MRIGELSRRAGISRDTIRFYERSGLIRSAPGRECTNNYRDYGEDAALTLEMIVEAQAAGMTLDDVKGLIAAVSVGGDNDVDAIEFLDARIAAIQATIARSKRFLATLRQTRAALLRGPDPAEFNRPG